MAWTPSTRFEDDLVDSQPGCNFVLGQMAYEMKREAEYTPRPPGTYEYLADRDKRNAEIDMQYGPASSKTKRIQDSLTMMERIQQISGTKPLGEHATMADWKDTSTVEQEAIAMMRHYGLMSMGAEPLAPLPLKEEYVPKGPIHLVRNGHRKLPLITDPEYFRPRKTRLAKDTTKSSLSTSFNDSGSYHTANDSTLDSIYGSAVSDVETTLSSQDDAGVPYKLLEKMTLEPKKTTATGPKPGAATGPKTIAARGPKPVAATGLNPIAATGLKPVAATGPKKAAETGAIPKKPLEKTEATAEPKKGEPTGHISKRRMRQRQHRALGWPQNPQIGN
ncbi:uncharacterized protein LOC111076177 [Drosophila obscura]|uniref:uncharacterized protein LOC111076177 n=1 Tax=Drosophila obscura TaxID=7282 RepID=UPI001BB11D5E|nr:uncharacterized protein LOC111076177 [Drosophila obscura]